MAFFFEYALAKLPFKVLYSQLLIRYLVFQTSVYLLEVKFILVEFRYFFSERLCVFSDLNFNNFYCFDQALDFSLCLFVARLEL